MTTTRLIVGCGYLGQRVARLWREQGDVVYAVTRSHHRADEFRAQGWRPVIADILDPVAIAAAVGNAIRTVDSLETVLFAVGYDRHANASIREVYVDGLRNVCDALGDPW